MAELILSISQNQVENEPDFSIERVFSRARRMCLTIKNLAMLTFINKRSQLHEKLNDKDVKYEDIDMTEEYLESNNETIYNK